MGYIPHTDEDRKAMLETIGVSSIKELFKDIPANLLFDGDLDVPKMLDERAIVKELTKIGAKNRCTDQLINFLGAGIYEHFSPSMVSTILQRGEFLSAYTPYQPELSQGSLQTIYEFQTMVCELTGMDVANASMYDAGSALAEAALMSVDITKRDEILVSEAVHPHYLDCIKTYAWGSGHAVRVIPTKNGYTELELLTIAVSDKTASVILQSPNFFGQIEDLKNLIEQIHKHGALAVIAVDPISLGVIKPPGDYGADIVIGEGQSLGWPMGYGGPLLGLFSCKQEFIRKIPGRIVGKTTDINGVRGYVMTLRTREQDIRREKATSNICTNEALIALCATVFMGSVGKCGFKKMAEGSLQNAHYAAKLLRDIPGVSLKFGVVRPYFKEFTLELQHSANFVCDAMLEKGFLAGLPLGTYFPEFENCLLTAVTEMRSREEIEAFAAAMKQVIAGNK